ncbi:unnamed protein product [Clonostachys rosea f. rosea IK726]|uniref:Uncharacterized protein n=1 Tax=Clonostachys rosea f. rosea IK726 TaxID=1349383 RepID=A0ACA9UKP7_BIOOC|nr:unnamed protein product [Clonostachys rosea f. rosea IK726]
MRATLLHSFAVFAISLPSFVSAAEPRAVDAKQVILGDFDAIYNLTQQAIDFEKYGYDRFRANGDCVKTLINLGKKVVQINKTKHPVTPLNDNDQKEVCDAFSGRRYTIHQGRLMNALQDGIFQGTKASFAGYYGALVRRFIPIFSEFEDWVINTIPNCKVRALTDRDVLLVFRQDAATTIELSRGYNKAQGDQIPDFV